MYEIMLTMPDIGNTYKTMDFNEDNNLYGDSSDDNLYTLTDKNTFPDAFENFVPMTLTATRKLQSSP
jgi:hypothetical protein